MQEMKISKELACHIAQMVFAELTDLNAGTPILFCEKNSGINKRKDTKCKECPSWAACYYASTLEEMITQGKFFGLEVVESKETREIDVSGRCENRKLDNQL